MKSIDEMKGLTDKGKALLRELKLERLVNEDYLRKLYERHKEFFDNPKSSPLPEIDAILIGAEVLKALDKLEHDVGDRFADDVTSTDHHYLRPFNLGARPNEKLLDAGGGAGEVVRLADHQLAHVYRVEAIHVFPGVDGEEDFFLVQVFGEGQLYQDTVDFRVVVQTVDYRYDFFLGGTFRKVNTFRIETQLFCGFFFSGNV